MSPLRLTGSDALPLQATAIADNIVTRHFWRTPPRSRTRRSCRREPVTIGGREYANRLRPVAASSAPLRGGHRPGGLRQDDLGLNFFKSV
jgi:hypothetical protein